MRFKMTSNLTDYVEFESNLDQICTAVHNGKPIDRVLVPNGKGKRVYDSTRWMGRIWNWFYNVADLIDPSRREKRLKAACEKTMEAFNNKFGKVEKEIELYETYLRKQFKNSFLPGSAAKSEELAAREEIWKWNGVTHSFVKLVKNQDSVLVKLFQVCFPVSITSELFNNVNLEKCLQLHSIIMLEKKVVKIPFEAIANIFNDQTEKVDRDQIKAWIPQLSKKNLISIEMIHQALKSMAKILFLTCDISVLVEKVAKLELLMQEQGFKRFMEPDPTFLKRRNLLKSGSIVKCNGTKINIGNMVKDQRIAQASILVFNVKCEGPAKVALFGINAAHLGIVNELRKKDNKGCDILALSELDEDGICGQKECMGRLDQQVNFWTSYGALSPGDLQKCKPIVNFLTKLLKENQMPKSFCNLNSAYFDDAAKNMFIGSDRIWFLKPTELIELEFMHLEDFVFRVSNGNHTVYKYLMENSKMSSHRIADHFFRVAQCNIDGKKLPNRYAANITDPSVEQREKMFADNVDNVFEYCCKNSNKKQDAEKIKKLVRNQLLLSYQSSKAVGRIMEGLEKEICSLVAEKLQ